MIRTLLLPWLAAISPLLLWAQPTTPPIVDSTYLLTLDHELPSRGQLGGVTVDQLGYIYVANFRDAVWRISPQGEVKLITDGLYGSSGNTIDASGNLYQASFYSHEIHKIDRFGKISIYANKELNGPVGMIFDDDDNLYVCSCSGNAIHRVASDGTVTTLVEGSLFSCPNGISRDEAGNLIVVNFNNEQVIRITPQGEADVLTTIPGGGGNGHIVYYNQNFYITKIKTGQIIRMSPQGDYAAIGGMGSDYDSAGPALTAGFQAPNGIGVDPQTGLLYVNTLRGQWTSREPTSIKLKAIKLATINKILTYYLDAGEIESARQAFRAYFQDPAHSHEQWSPALTGLAWNYMTKRQISNAQVVFELTAEAYPEQWRSHYNLGEYYKIIGQAKQAKAHYKKALEKDPDNELIQGRLAALK